jgi:hypothetical protein
MPYRKATLHKRDVLKGHLIASVIRLQEQSDRVRTECVKLEETSGYEAEEAYRCHESADHLQRKADRYVRRYMMLKKVENKENTEN